MDRELKRLGKVVGPCSVAGHSVRKTDHGVFGDSRYVLTVAQDAVCTCPHLPHLTLPPNEPGLILTFLLHPSHSIRNSCLAANQFVELRIADAGKTDVIGGQASQQRFSQLGNFGDPVCQPPDAVLERVSHQSTIPEMAIAFLVQVMKPHQYAMSSITGKLILVLLTQTLEDHAQIRKANNLQIRSWC